MSTVYFWYPQSSHSFFCVLPHHRTVSLLERLLKLLLHKFYRTVPSDVLSCSIDGVMTLLSQSEVMPDKEQAFLAQMVPLLSVHQWSLTYPSHWEKCVDNWDMVNTERDHILGM